MRKKSKITETGTHSFSVDEAIELGLEKSLILKEIRRMSIYKLRNGKSPYVYYSSSALAEKFPYFKSASIRRWTVELEKSGHLVSIVKNEKKYDKTKSYAPNDIIQTLAQKVNSVAQNEQRTAQNEQPIPPLSTPRSVSKDTESDDFAVAGAKEKWESKDLADYMEAMRKHTAPHVRIIGYYLASKGVSISQYGNRRQIQFECRRHVRPASRLTKSFEESRITQTIDFLAENAKFKWTLETVEKYITERNLTPEILPGYRNYKT